MTSNVPSPELSMDANVLPTAVAIVTVERQEGFGSKIFFKIAAECVVVDSGGQISRRAHSQKLVPHP